MDSIQYAYTQLFLEYTRLTKQQLVRIALGFANKDTLNKYS
jgi:hypothetical protein